MADEIESSNANEVELEVIQPSPKKNFDAAGGKRKPESIEEWLATHSLSEFGSKMQAFGITEVSHLEDVNGEEDAQSEFGMSRFQARRLLRAFQEWKSQQQKAVKRRPVDSSVNNAGSSFKTNNKSVVVTLPPAFQGYFGTRDGGKSVIVNSAMLQKKWTSLWYENPLNPFQEASNSFILKMCESKQHKFKSSRECEKWAREERERRIQLLLAVEKRTAGWTTYYKKKSIYGALSLLQERYPAVAVLDMEKICKTDYDACVCFRDEIDVLNNELKEHEDRLKRNMSSTLAENGSVKKGQLLLNCLLIFFGLYNVFIQNNNDRTIMTNKPH